MNELAIIFDKMGIDTKAVIEAAAGNKMEFSQIPTRFSRWSLYQC
jgi:UDP-N-acetyl-D-mannosaminuronate dehydrogenase